MTDRPLCFGFYTSSSICSQCVAQKRCKAILVSHGLDILGDSIESMLLDFPDNATFTKTDRITVMMDELLKPSTAPPVVEVDPLVALAAARQEELDSSML